MRSGVTPDSALRMQFRTPGVRLLVAGLCVNIRSDVSAVIEQFLQMYVGHKLEAGAGSDDFRIDISYTDPLQRLLRRRTRLLIEDDAPFHPLPHRLAYILIEAGLNWCISATASNVVLHAGVVERGGVAVVLPAPSGSGKSTLCAALVTRGWRLLSDELAVLRPADGRLQPVARPISLKNESIALIRRWAPSAHFSPVFTGTIRGDIAFLRPPAESVARAAETVAPALIVSPAYQAAAPVTLQPLGKSETFRLLARSCMDYHTTQRCGFDTLARMVDSCAAYRLSYGTLAEGVEAMETLLARAQTGHANGRPATATA